MSHRKSTLKSKLGTVLTASALALSFALANGCATTTSGVKAVEVTQEPESALMAIALSVHNGEAEEIHVVDDQNNDRSLSLVQPTMRLANEDVFIYKLDPKKTYTIKSFEKGSHRTLMDKTAKHQFQVEPGTITYICSYMLYQKEKFAEAVTAQASEHTGVAQALKEQFPNRKFRYGYKRSSANASANPSDSFNETM